VDELVLIGEIAVEGEGRCQGEGEERGCHGACAGTLTLASSGTQQVHRPLDQFVTADGVAMGQRPALPMARSSSVR